MPEDQPAGEPGGQSVPPDPAGVVLMPHGVGEGEATLPFAVSAGVGLTPPDAKGRRFDTLQISDGTVTFTLRMPWQNAAAFGMGIAQGLAQIQQKAEQEAGPALLL